MTYLLSSIRVGSGVKFSDSSIESSVWHPIDDVFALGEISTIGAVSVVVAIEMGVTRLLNLGGESLLLTAVTGVLHMVDLVSCLSVVFSCVDVTGLPHLWVRIARPV